jgi:hypothetical protein
LPSAVSHSRPIFTSIRDFDYETAIRDSATCSYAWKRLTEVLHRQTKVFRDGGVRGFAIPLSVRLKQPIAPKGA